MNRTIILVRHAKSIGGRYDKNLFPIEGPPLSDQGIIDAKRLTAELNSRNIDLNQSVAVSELIRTQQTAIIAGFKHLVTNDLLNEVNSGLSETLLEQLLQNKQVPKNAIVAAQNLLNNPPAENIWVTHGLVIAGIGHVLNIPVTDLYIPDMASITKISLN